MNCAGPQDPLKQYHQDMRALRENTENVTKEIRVYKKRVELITSEIRRSIDVAQKNESVVDITNRLATIEESLAINFQQLRDSVIIQDARFDPAVVRNTIEAQIAELSNLQNEAEALNAQAGVASAKPYESQDAFNTAMNARKQEIKDYRQGLAILQEQEQAPKNADELSAELNKLEKEVNAASFDTFTKQNQKEFRNRFKALDKKIRTKTGGRPKLS